MAYHLPRSLPVASALSWLVCGLAFPACVKEDIGTCFEERVACPIPSELPAETCDGAHTLGAMFDTILFVANYAPNNSGIGSSVPEGGLRASWQGGGEYIEVSGEHAIRPRNVDPRFARVYIIVRENNITRISLSYNQGSAQSVRFKSSDSLHVSSSLYYDSQTGILCGTFSGPLITTSGGFGYERGDTILVTDGVVDTEVFGAP